MSLGKKKKKEREIYLHICTYTSVRRVSRSKIAGPCFIYILSFTRYCQTVFQRDYTHLNEQGMGVSSVILHAGKA